MARIFHLNIENFRGIKKLNWHIDERVNCLIGPGDTTKTTILNAIEFVLAPRWNINFTDSDFYNLNIENPIQIEATVGELPEKLIKENGFGLYSRGYSTKSRKINDDPQDEDRQVITIQLIVDENLEPKWVVFKESQEKPKPISWRDREKLNVSFLGNYVDRDLTWAKGSALSRLTDRDESAHVIAFANREAREAVSKMELKQWEEIEAKARNLSRDYGVFSEHLKPGLDISAIRFGYGLLALHDKNIPLSLKGLGSKRLLALSIQEASSDESSIILLDEVEYGLEPHRIRRLLSRLCENRKKGQIFLTTHSPTPVVALSLKNLRFIKCIDGNVKIAKCRLENIIYLQSLIREDPISVFAKKIIVCEGKTEVAFCMKLNEFWNKKREKNFEILGVTVAYGRGNTYGPKSALQFRKLGYKTMFFGDSDVPIQPSEKELTDAEVKVLLWPQNRNIEETVTAHLPWDRLQNFIDCAIEIKGKNSVLESIKTHFSEIRPTDLKIDYWKKRGYSESKIREIIGMSSSRGKNKKKKKSAWFKDLNSGEKLAQIIFDSIDDLLDTPIGDAINQVGLWVNE
jgi:predicted ATP-dependent endonuclease of OLD family